MTEKKEILRELKEISSKVTELISKLEKEEKEKEMILEGRYEQNETIEKCLFECNYYGDYCILCIMYS